MPVRTLLTSSLLPIAALCFTACATPDTDGPRADTPREFADYEGDPRLGEQVDRICFGSSINGFGQATDNSVLLESRVNDRHLVHTFQCPDLDRAQSLSFDQFGSCLTRGDTIIAFDSAFGPRGNTRHPDRCTIRAIYEWFPDREADQMADETPEQIED